MRMIRQMRWPRARWAALGAAAAVVLLGAAGSDNSGHDQALVLSHS